MKKLSLHIKEPCHENWDGMTQQEKGKFCGSCQKTVIDFTSMSDRQIAEFFKKPAGNVCGRFYQDQLQRPMEIPKKRIPWVKYFFHVAWPAFILFLKGCREKQNIAGDVVVKEIRDMRCDELQVATVGFVMPKIIAVDTPKIIQSEIIDTKCTITTTGLVGVEPTQRTLMGDTIATSLENFEVLKEDKEEIKEAKEMETVNIIGYPPTKCTMLTGAVAVIRKEEIPNKANDVRVTNRTDDAETTVYPNPAKAGSEITITSSLNNEIIQVQLFSSSGAMIKTIQTNNQSNINTKFSLPASMSAGTYFLKIILRDKKVKTAKIIVIQ